MPATMTFDKLAKVVENHKDLLAPFHPIMQSAALFHFPAWMHEYAEEHPLTDEELLFFNDHFFLPFPCMAVEDPASCILLWETAETAGLGNTYFYLEATPLDRDNATLDKFADAKQLGQDDTEQLRQFMKGVEPGTLGLAFGRLEYTKFDPAVRNDDGKMTRHYFVQNSAYMVLSPTQVLVPPGAMADMDPVQAKSAAEAAGRNVATAIEEVMVFNTPNRFVLEKSNLKADKWMQKNMKNGRVTRSDIRPVYTLVTPQQAQEAMGITKEHQGGTKKPHARRRHFRTFKSDRYSDKVKGSTIVIPASWVGPEEKQIKNKRYRVRIDL